MSESDVKNLLDIRDLGVSEYKPVLELQKQLAEERFEGKVGNTVLLVEHPAVITLGAREYDNKILEDTETLKRRGVELVQIRRGGAATAHNPGQIVFYPIIDLRSVGLDINEYIRELEAVGVELLERLGVEAGRRKGFPGLWVDGEKIASIGVRVSRGITYHGMAVNINNDLSIFDSFVPCGLDGVVMTSVRKKLGKDSEMSEVKSGLTELLMAHFSKGQASG